MRVLAIGAHPDDIELGAGGTLLKHQASGHVLHILVLTSGETGCGDGYRPEDREREAEEAALILDAGITFGRLPDTRLPDGKETIEVIEAAALDFRPDVAYVHSAHDTHQDHRAAAVASRVALRGVRRLYAYQAPSATSEFTPQRYPDITPFIDLKLELIRAHKSQYGARRYMEEDYVVSTARYWGLQAGCRLSEPMEVVFDRDGSPGTFGV